MGGALIVADTETRPQIEVVAIHRVQLADGKLAFAFGLASEAGAEIPRERRGHWALGKVKAPLAGCIYRATGTVGADGKLEGLALGSLRFVRRVDGDHATGWRLRDEAAQADKRAEALERKVRSSPALEREVAQLAALYRKLDYRERAGFASAIMAAIHAANRK